MIDDDSSKINEIDNVLIYCNKNPKRKHRNMLISIDIIIVVISLLYDALPTERMCTYTFSFHSYACVTKQTTYYFNSFKAIWNSTQRVLFFYTPSFITLWFDYQCETVLMFLPFIIFH